MKATRKITSLFLCAAMLFSMLPQTVFAAGADSGAAESGLCAHHPQHDEACGYAEGSAGAPCAHEHTEACYTLITECVHEHTEACYTDGLLPEAGEEKEADACQHECSEAEGCVTRVLACPHESGAHDAACGYAPATEGAPCRYVCEICNAANGAGDIPADAAPANAENGAGEVCICTEPCVDGNVNAECLVCSMDFNQCAGEEPSAPGETPVCICTEPCAEGGVNADCPVCSADFGQCAGEEPSAPEETPVCICTEPCAEGGVNADCPVCSADFGKCAGEAPSAPEETPVCICTVPCAEGGVNADCPVCSADFSLCEGAGNAADEAVQAVQALIDELPTVEELESMGLEERQVAYAQVQAAYDAYDALTDEQKAQISGAEIFDALFAVFNGMANTLAELSSGYFGENDSLHWSLDDNGTLTISGPGAMPNLSFSSWPWDNSRSLITNVVINDGVTSIGDYAFYNCSRLTSITIPSSVTSIGDWTFTSCSSLTRIEIPEGVTSIGDWTFASCIGLTSIKFPESVTSIGSYAFYVCTGLTSIEIPEGVTSIGDDAFYACTGLTSIEIPEGVTSIGDDAFYGCIGLTSITIPSSVTSIGDDAFLDCTMKEITFEGTTAPTLGGSNTLEDNSLMTIHIPTGSTGYGGTNWPNNVAYIDGDNNIYYVLTVGAGTSGTALANPAGPLVKVGETVTLTATPDRGYEFAGWNVTQGSVNIANTNTFAMPESGVTVTANFTALAMPAAPTQNGSSGTNAITVNSVTGQRYAITTTGTAPNILAADTWTAATGDTLTFSNLASGTHYYIWTYIPGSGTRGDSLVSPTLSAYTAPDITTTTLSNATVGQSYSATLAATSAETVTWSISNGTLPSGLTLSGNTISGTPTAATTSPASITVTASVGNGSASSSVTLSLAVNRATLAAPGNPAWDSTTPGRATWSAVANASGYSVQLYRDGSAAGNAVSVSNGTSYDFTITEAGSYTFTVTATGGSDYNNSTASSQSAALHTVSFDTNGGTGTISMQLVPEGEKATAPSAPTRTGHDFDGWYSDSTFAEGSAWNFDTSTVIAATTLYARWTACDYEVTLNTNGGTINSGNVTEYTYGQGATLPTDVTRAGYTFGGWYENQALTGEAVTEISATATGEKTYYARWTLDAPTVNPSGGGSYPYGTAVTLRANASHAAGNGVALSYQWYKDGAAISGATADSLTLANVSDSGEYHIAVTADDGNQKIQTQSAAVKVKISEAASGFTAPTANTNLTYTGQPHELVTAGTASGGTMLYSLNNVDYSENIPTGTNAGTYTVWYKVEGDGNHNDSEAFFLSVTIAPLTAELVWSGYENLTYTGNPVNVTATVGNLVAGDVCTVTVTGGAETNAGGPYTATATALSNGNYALPEAGATQTYSIGKAASGVVAAPTARENLTYTGQPHELVTAGTASGGTMLYSLNNVDYSENIPTATNADTYTVWYKVEGDLNHSDSEASSLSVTIAPLTAELVWSGYENLTYTGNPVNVTATVGNLISGDSCTVTVTGGAETNAGGPYTAAATALSNGNYALPEAGATQAYSIGAAASGIVASPTARENLTYTGQPQALVTAGTASGGTMLYSLNGEDYSAEIPTGTNAGTYTVWYKVQGDLNHSDSEAASLEARIGEASQDAPASGTGYAIDYEQETIAAESGYELSATNGAEATGSGALNVVPGTNVYIRLAGTDNREPSPWTEVTVPARPDAPGGVAIANKGGDFIVVSAAEGQEYSVNGLDWTESGTFEGLSADREYTVYARVRAVSGASFASNAVTRAVTTLRGDGSGTLAPGESLETEDGTIIRNDGDSVTIIGGEPPATTTVTLPEGEDDVDVGSGGDVEVPGGSTVQTGDGLEIALPDGGSVDAEGGITLPEGGSAAVDTGDETVTITTPEGGKIQPDGEGGLILPGGSTVESGGGSVTIPESGGNITADGALEYNVTVTFDSQGGSAVASQTITVGGTATEPDAPTRTGYVFAGWYESGAETAYDFSAAVNADITLYARWTAERYTVTLHLNGGTVHSGDVTEYTYGEGAALPSDITREGHIFGGWYASADFSGEAVTAISASEVGDREYWAKWTAVEYAIAVTATRGGSASASHTTAAAGTEITLTARAEDGYAFVRWEVVSGNIAIRGGRFVMPEEDVSVRAVFVAREDEQEDEDTPLTAAQMAQMLANGEAVEGLVTDRRGEAMPYAPLTTRTLDEVSAEEIKRTLVFSAEPVRDEDGEIMLSGNGEPVYEQRNLNLSQALLEALAELGYTHIRFNVKDAALEWAIADMTEDGNIIRLAPMEVDELSQREVEAIGEAEQLSGAYRARITAIIDGEETDITAEIPSLMAWFNAEAVRALTEEESAQCLLVPGDETLEAAVSEAEYVEEGEDEKEVSYQAALAASGLFVLVLQ